MSAAVVKSTHSPLPNGGETVGVLVGMLVNALKNPEIKKNEALSKIITDRLSQLLDMRLDTPLPESKIGLYNRVNKLIDSNGKIDGLMAEMLKQPKKIGENAKIAKKEEASASSGSTPIPVQKTISVIAPISLSATGMPQPVPTLSPATQQKTSKISEEQSMKTKIDEERKIIASKAYGSEMWKKYFGDVGQAPLLPPDIAKILKSACPFFPGKTVEQTHILALVPATLNGTPMTLKRMGELMGKLGKPGYYINSLFHTYADTPFETSHWILMLNTVIEETRNKSYAAQKEIVAKHGNYRVPKLAEAVVAIFMEHVATGAYRFGRDPCPWTYTRCEETYESCQMCIGGFAPAGLNVCFQGYFRANSGVAPLRKFS